MIARGWTFCAKMSVRDSLVLMQARVARHQVISCSERSVCGLGPRGTLKRRAGLCELLRAFCVARACRQAHVGPLAVGAEYGLLLGQRRQIQA